MGVSDEGIKAKLLEKDHETFNEVVQLANTLSSIKVASRDDVSCSYPLNTVRNIGACFSCGDKHIRKLCKYKNATCKVCKKIGHISNVCKSRSNSLKTSVREVSVSESECNSVEEVADTLYTLNTTQGSALSSSIMIPIVINKVVVNMLLDTGSSVTIISENTWRTVGDGELTLTSKTLTSFTGHPVRLLGEGEVTAEYKQIKKCVGLYVAAGKVTNLLGRDWITHFDLDKHTLHELGEVCTNYPTTNVALKHSGVELNKLISTFSELFKKNEKNYCKNITAKLYLKPNTIPVFKKARPVPIRLRDNVKDEIDRLVQNGVLEEIDYSEWAAPCVIVRKPNGNLRICADFSTGLNESLQIQKFPLPTQEELFSKLNGGNKFSTLDLSDAYLSVPVDESSKKLLVINTIKGLFRYKRLCFGVAPAPAIFQKIMYTMLEGLDGVACFLDDIIVTGKDDREHLCNLRQVLTKINEYGFRINKEKSKFLQESVHYLGFEISSKGISTRKDKIEPILKLPRPSDVKKLESFLGMVTFYSKFIPKFSDICQPLNLLRKKYCKWDWSIDCENAFISLKNALTETPVLAHYDPGLPVILAADASSVGVGAAIFHRYPDGTERPIAYASKTLTSAEQNYSQIEREALGIIYGIKKFRCYLFGRQFLLQTDHRPLLSIFGSNKGIPTMTSCRLQRWALFLSNYTFKIEYIPTKSFGKVGGLSRLPLGEDYEFDKSDGGYERIVSMIYAERMRDMPVTDTDIATETAKDQTLATVLDYIKGGWPREIEDKNLKNYASKKDALVVFEGCILWGVRVVIPPKYRPTILKYLHETHLGMVKMKALAREKLWWPGLDEDIENVSRSCHECNSVGARQPQKQYLSSWPTASGPWCRIHIDFAGPFLNSYFLLVVDSFSGWMEVFPMKTMNTESTVEHLKSLMCRYGLPNTIVSDNGPSFTSQQFLEFCKSFGIKHVTTPAYHPASNGQVEKYVHTMKSCLKKLCNTTSSRQRVNEQLQNFLFRYRVSPHVATGMSPAEKFLGRKIRSELDILKPQIPKSMTGDEREAKKTKHFKEEQLVYVHIKEYNKYLWKPGVIKRRIGRNVWLVEMEGRVIKRHADQLKPRKSGSQET